MKILLAVDGSSYSRAAVREVGRRPWPEGSEARVVLVDGPLGGSTFPPGASPRVYDDLTQRQRDDANDELDKSASELRQLAPQLKVSVVLLEGAPKEEIVGEARRWNADLIVVGSHGRGAVKSLFLGSVSLAVVLNAPCSVLIVRKPEGQDSVTDPRG